MLECRFKSCLGLEFSCSIKWHFLELVIRGFLSLDTTVSSSPSSVTGFGQSKNKKVNVSPAVSKLIADLSLCHIPELSYA